MLSVVNAEIHRRRYLEHTSLIFEPSDHVHLEAIRLVDTSHDLCVESFEIQSSDELLHFLAVSPMTFLWHRICSN